MRRRARGPSLRPLRGRLGAGFTLIEILVAVAVLAVAMGAAITGMARYADNAAYLREKTFALWVAHNRLTEIDLEPHWPGTGESDGDAELAGVRWKWHVKVTETADPNVRRVDIGAHVEGRTSDAAALSSFVGNR